MRILYDTNVLVTIFARREAILEFKRLVVQTRIVPISSSHILNEVEAVLTERMHLTRQKAKSAARVLARQSQIVEPRLIEKVCRDPFDDYVLAAGVEGRADYIVTADKDLLVIGEHHGVKIITPAELKVLIRIKP